MRAPQRKQQTTASLYLCSSGLHQRAGISQEATGFTLYCRELKGLKKHRSERRTGGLMEPQTHLLRLHTRRMSSAEKYTQPLLPYVLFIILFMFIYVCIRRFKGGTVSDFNWLVKS